MPTGNPKCGKNFDYPKTATKFPTIESEPVTDAETYKKFAFRAVPGRKRRGFISEIRINVQTGLQGLQAILQIPFRIVDSSLSGRSPPVAGEMRG